MSDQLERLSRRFPAADVKTRSQSGLRLHYIDIPETIKRFNEVCPEYDFKLGPCTYEATGETTNSGKPTFRAQVSGHITVPGIGTRGGVGSHTSHDVDMALKSAQAEAMKKAGHQFGVGLYLWDERERTLVDLVNKGSTNKAAALLMEIEGIDAATAKKEYKDAKGLLKAKGLL